jgi:Zn-dependent peptidase ImmA (M78 family)
MTESITIGPKQWGIRLNRMLDQYHGIHGGDRYPVNVEFLAEQIPTTFNTGEPILVQGEEINDDFEGCLYKLEDDAGGPPSWALIYNQAIPSEGRIRFTLAHELGHYLCHRQLQGEFNCSEADTLHWESPERQMENQANEFASYLLMPRTDFEAQIGSANVDLDVLGGCADRYGVSLTAAVLKWLEFTSKRAVLVMSRDGRVQWARGSESGKWLSIALNKRLPNGQRRSLPARSVTLSNTTTNVDKQGSEIDARTWFESEPKDMSLREMKIVSDQYKQSMSLLILPKEIPPWERGKPEDDDAGVEDTLSRFERNGQPLIR